jgi:hypothetical protein
LASKQIPPAEDCSVVVTHAIADGAWRPVYWEVRNSAMGELVTSAIWSEDSWCDLLTTEPVSLADIPVPEEVTDRLASLLA